MEVTEYLQSFIPENYVRRLINFEAFSDRSVSKDYLKLIDCQKRDQSKKIKDLLGFDTDKAKVVLAPDTKITIEK